MGTVDLHPHVDVDHIWLFNAPVNTAVFVSSPVLDGGLPFLLVCHDHDGEWQFLHGDVGEGDKCIVACLGCMVQRDKSVALLGDLPVGWCARRPAVGAPWQRVPYEPRNDV